MAMPLLSVLTAFGTLVQTAAKNDQPIADFSKDMAKQVVKNKDLNAIIDMTLHGGRLTSVIADYTIEPLILSTRGAIGSEGGEAAAHLATNIFTAYYVQTFQILTNVYGIEPNTVVLLLSSKIAKGGLKGTITDAISTASDQTSLDALISNNRLTLFKDMIASEAINGTNPIYNAHTVENKNEGTDLYATLTRNVSVQVDLKNGNIISLPINVFGRLVSIDANSLISICSPRGEDKSFWNRLDEYRSGAITLTDFLFGTDLIKEYKKGRLENTNTDSIDRMNSRARSATAKFALTGLSKGFEANYNFYIITHDDLQIVNKYMRNDIVTKDKVKEDFLDQARAMGIIILDDDYQKATVLIKDIYGSSTMSYKALFKQSKVGKDSSDNFSEILKALTANRAIGF